MNTRKSNFNLMINNQLILVHRHWDWFLKDIHKGEIIDQPGGYGWEGARALDKSLAIFNADSYGWFATEYLWTIICSRDGGYDPPNDDAS